jgi:antitoxin VapB
VSLNIKNERVHELAREAARVTGKSQTAAIQEALERLLADHDEREQGEIDRKVARLLVIGRRFREEESDPPSDAIRTIEDLYDDETGLSR